MRLALPMAMQNLISFLVTLADTVMVGVLGDTALSAVSLASQPYLIFNTLVFGISSGGTVLASQYRGKGKIREIRETTTVIMWLAIMLSLLYGGICVLFPKQIISLFSNDTAVISTAVPYLRIIVISYIFNAVSLCYLAVLKAVENVKIATKVYTCSLLIKIFVTWIMIFVLKTGIEGAAAATIAARAFEMICCIVYSMHEEQTGFRFTQMFSININILVLAVKQSLPIILHELNWSVATSAQVAVIGNVSSVFLTAQSIALIPQDLAVAFLQGLASAAAVMTGNEIGKGHKETAFKNTKKLLRVSLAAGIMSCLLILITRSPFLLLYPNITQEGIELSYQLITILAFLSISLAIEYCCLIGILRGAGDTFFAFLCDSGCMWLIGLPLGWAAANIWHCSYPVIFLLLKCDTAAKVILCMIRMRNSSYMKDITVK